MDRVFKNYRAVFTAFLLLFLAGCEEEKPVPAPEVIPAITLQKFYGDNQKGFPSLPLDEPIKVKVLDENGMPLANKEVNFEVTPGSGYVSSGTARTDQDGIAEVLWVLGNTAPEQSLKAILPDADSLMEVEFIAKLKACTVAGGNGYGSAAKQLTLPYGIFVDPAGNVYVADRDNNRVQKWAPGATEGVTVAGGNGMGSGPNQLFNPYGIAVDAAGNIYIADSGNDRVQKWAPGATSGAA